jgi:hypothetical protein
MKIAHLAAAAALAAFAFPAAAAENVRPQDPGSLIRALQANGYAGKLGADGTGDPMVTSGVGGTEFQIFFYNCTNHKGCATVQFHSAYKLDKPVALDRLNEWNRTKRFTRAFIDKDNNVVLEMDVDLDDGGVAPLLFIDNIEFWGSLLPEFERFVGYRT